MVLSQETQQLLSDQTELGGIIDRLAVNFKKAGTVRRTIPHLQRQMATISGYWSDFQYNHNLITGTVDIPLDNEYFAKFYKNKIEAVVTQFKNEVEKAAAILYPGQDIFSNDEKQEQHYSFKDDDQQKYVNSINNIKLMITAFDGLLNDFNVMDPALKTAEVLKEIHQRFKTKWKLIHELHSKLI